MTPAPARGRAWLLAAAITAAAIAPFAWPGC
jgi:hypothetical protein